MLDNHPFTVMSAPRGEKRGDGCQSLVFLARAQSSFTKKLALYRAAHPNSQTGAWIDGPYGGLSQPVERLYDTAVLAAGGTGITACLSDLAEKEKTSRPECDGREYVGTKRVVLIWAVREADHFAWVQNNLEETIEAAAESEVEIKMKFTSVGPRGLATSVI